MKGALLGIGLAALAVSLPGMEAEKTAANLKQPLCRSWQSFRKAQGRRKNSLSFPSRPVGSSDGRRDGENSYEKDGETRRPMASTTKIMTCILALEEGNPEGNRCFRLRGVYAGRAAGIREGEKYY